MAARLIEPYMTYNDANGVPLAGGLLHFYVSESVSTDKDTFSDDTLLTANANPIVLDSAGRAGVDVWGDGLYKLVVSTAADAAVETYDPVSGGIGVTALTNIAALTALTKASLTTGDEFYVSGYTTQGDGGGGRFYWDSTSATTENSVTIFEADEGGTGRWVRILSDNNIINIYMAGTVGSGLVDDQAPVELWLDYLIANGGEGVANDGTFLIAGTIDKPINGGMKLSGNATFKASGSNRFDLINLTSCTGRFVCDGLTFDGDNIVSKLFRLENESSTPSTLGSVYFGPDTKFINVKNNSPDTFTASSCIVRGGFTKVVFEGNIDGCNSNVTNSAVTEGFVTDFFVTADDDWIREVVITGEASFKNVKNDNSAVADADGLKCGAPTDKWASLVVQPGAYFENNKGRSIKSQVARNIIDGAVILRDAYDGLMEIDIQYCGGIVSNTDAVWDGVTCPRLINITRRTAPTTSDIATKDNKVVITGSPATDPVEIVRYVVDDATLNIEGCSFDGDKCDGATDYVYTFRAADVAGNFANIHNSWAETINIAFIQTFKFGTGNPEVQLNVTGNSAKNVAPAAVAENEGTSVSSPHWKENINIPVHGNPVDVVTAGITAFAGGGNANAIELVAEVNEISTVATTGDSVKLLTAVAGLRQSIVNNGVNACDVYPSVNDDLGAGVNTAISLAAGASVEYRCYNTVNWFSV